MERVARAMLLERVGHPLRLGELRLPEPQGCQVLLRVRACGVCRTDLHIYEGDLPHPKLPLVLGHEVVGEVVALGPEASRFRLGQRVGVPWLGYTCGRCRYCLRGQENLCE
ncbi:MAG: alcohol dehydrogenase catalytic domain-containing protein, partial [Meiothermus sp.]|uniref:alcohol dehydrogenase catalytic domain-containing protein n=1 Tax=Meiothermus sp. TaxID=1955249 RepID=UPI0025F12339